MEPSIAAPGRCLHLADPRPAAVRVWRGARADPGVQTGGTLCGAAGRQVAAEGNSAVRPVNAAAFERLRRCDERAAHPVRRLPR